MRARSALPTLGALFMVAFPLRAAKPDAWVEGQSAHFHVVSNAKPKEALEATRRLEELRQLFALMFPKLRLDPPAPARLVLFKDSKSFAAYKPVTVKGKTDRLGGFMQPGPDRMYLAVDWNAFGAQNTLYHEYVHLVMHLNFGVVPPWLNEGMAELYEHTEVSGVDFKVGEYDPGWWELLQRNKLIPLEVLVQLDYHKQPFQSEEHRALFYAESWALVHFLAVGDKGARGPQFARFLQLYLQGVDQETAFRQAFGADFDGLQKRLEDYLGHRSVEYFYGKITERIEHATVDFTPLDSRVAQAYLSDLWLNRGEMARAEEALRPLAASENAPPEVSERLGRIAVLQGKGKEAEEHLEAALKVRPEDIGLRYYAAWAISLGRLQAGSTPEERRAAADRVVELLTPVVQAPNPFPQAEQLLLQARLIRNDPPEELIPAIEQAQARDPNSREFDLMLAFLYERAERWNDAENLLRQVIARAQNPEQRRQAEQQLDSLQTRRMLVRSQSDQPVLRVAEPEGEQPQPEEPQPAREREVYNPEPAPQGAPPEVRYLKGTLAQVECADESAVLTIKQERKASEPVRVVHLKVRSLVQLIVLDPTGSGKTLACGEADIPVGINYRVEPQGDAIAGVVMTVELYPPKR